MLNKKIRSKFKVCLGITLCTLAVLSAPVTTLHSQAAEPTDVETCAEIKEWVYKIVDGKLYKIQSTLQCLYWAL